MVTKQSTLLAFSKVLRHADPSVILCRVNASSVPALDYYSDIAQVAESSQHDLKLPMIHSLPDWSASPEYFWSAIDNHEKYNPICWLLVAHCPEENQEFLFQSFLQRIFFQRHLSFSALLNANTIYALFSQRPVGCWTQADFFLSSPKGGSPRCHINSRSILQAYASVFSSSPSLLSVTGELKL